MYQQMRSQDKIQPGSRENVKMFYYIIPIKRYLISLKIFYSAVLFYKLFLYRRNMVYHMLDINYIYTICCSRYKESQDLQWSLV